MNLLVDYLYAVIFFIVGVGFVLAGFVVNMFLSSRKYTSKQNIPYECGIQPFGSPFNIQHLIRYYIICLVFIIFEVEIAFLIPWAVVFKEMGMFAFIEMFIFIFILILGLIYAFAKGVFRWV